MAIEAGPVYIDEIPIGAPPVDADVDIAAAAGGEQLNMRILESSRTLAVTKCETICYNFRVEY